MNLPDYQIAQLARLHHDQLDFLYELASTYSLSKSDVQRLCFFMRIDYAELLKHTLDNQTKH